jgi:hypothetical protein
VLGSEKREGCRNWRAALGETVADDDSIDLVITSGSTRVFARNMPEPEQQRAIADAFLGLWDQWTSAGRPGLVILDDPVAKKSIPECIAASKVTEDPCARDRASELPDDPVNLALAPGAPDGVTVLDLTGSQCDSETCHFVVGGVITHYDRGHMTSTFVRSLEPYIAPVLGELVGTR